MEPNKIIMDACEYNESPPLAIVKVMDRFYANQLIESGSMLFSHLGVFRAWENPVLGDKFDGIAKLKRKESGSTCTIGCINPVYAWCAALPVISPERVSTLANSNKYNCIVRINNTRLMIERFTAALSKQVGSNVHPICGMVSYDKGKYVGEESLGEIISSHEYRLDIFQKDTKFTEDREYRVSFTDYRRNSNVSNVPNEIFEPKCITLTIGNCSDIMEIAALPNIS